MNTNKGLTAERRLALIHRVMVPDNDYPREYAILVTDRRSLFLRQPKTRGTFWLRGEMKWGTALVTDVTPKTLQDYEDTDLETLAKAPGNFTVPHDSVASLVMRADKPVFRAREFWVKWTMQRQKEIFQVYNFEMKYRKTPIETDQIQFYAVPLGSYFKPRRQTQTRQVILQEYADEILAMYRGVLSVETINALRTATAEASGAG